MLSMGAVEKFSTFVLLSEKKVISLRCYWKSTILCLFCVMKRLHENYIKALRNTVIDHRNNWSIGPRNYLSGVLSLNQHPSSEY